MKILIIFLSFSLTKKKQKVKAKRQLQFFSHTSLRNATEKIVVRTVSPNPAAPVPTYAVV